MASDAKAMLLGIVEPARIEAVLSAKGFALTSIFNGGDLARYTVKNESGCYLGVISIYGADQAFHEGADIFDGERTVVSATASLDFVVSDLVNELGGYFRLSEPDAEFTFVEGRQALELEPRERLRVPL
jgi:hypothetical protein